MNKLPQKRVKTIRENLAEIRNLENVLLNTDKVAAFGYKEPYLTVEFLFDIDGVSGMRLDVRQGKINALRQAVNRLKMIDDSVFKKGVLA